MSFQVGQQKIISLLEQQLNVSEKIAELPSFRRDHRGGTEAAPFSRRSDGLVTADVVLAEDKWFHPKYNFPQQFITRDLTVDLASR